ncbi:hypothetical protein [Nostoc sp. 'Peltigera membranacea cyanobiont' N6]|uniref:hypothetical protein n=1 Tax=Nostoc sp. 'Peltigera membranacea cyanobiont' N6 TaxID=1261031 RepID=UPI000CF316D7|nr:hypothetical protein [Nostoc sp. 'Peltigera membranacea cyanobiont' N6]
MNGRGMAYLVKFCLEMDLGGNQVSGRVKFSLEFIPDPQEDEVTEDTEDGSEKLRELKALPESSLDDLRAELLDI